MPLSSLQARVRLGLGCQNSLSQRAFMWPAALGWPLQPLHCRCSWSRRVLRDHLASTSRWNGETERDCERQGLICSRAHSKLEMGLGREPKTFGALLCFVAWTSSCNHMLTFPTSGHTHAPPLWVLPSRRASPLLPSVRVVKLS